MSGTMFQAEVAQAEARFRKSKPGTALPTYWQAHFRVLGLKARTFSRNVAKRGGQMVLKCLLFKLVPPGANWDRTA